MSYYNLCGIGSQHSNISKGKRGVHIKITGMQDSNQDNFGFENYLHILSDFNRRKSFTKFRISNHKLKIETGRYSKPITPLENRICKKCFSDEIESVIT
jgi:hypothetical protein